MRRPTIPSNRASRLLHDERGVALIWTILVTAPFLFAFGGLLLDGHRTLNVYNEAQSFVDRSALAAAMELNGRPDAITRAIEAACGPAGDGPLVTDAHTYGRAADTLVADQLLFLAELDTDPLPPDEDSRPAGDVVLCSATCGSPAPDCGDDADRLATFVEVVSAPVQVNYALWPVMRAFGVTDAAMDSTVTAFAVAGFTRAVCDTAPLWMCNPLQSAGASIDDPSYLGMQMRVKMGGGSAGGSTYYVPGNFGLFDAIDGTGASDVRDAMARLRPNTRCTAATGDFKPGQSTGPVEMGMNVRWDMFTGVTKNYRGKSDYPPDVNVTKGQVTTGKNCDTAPSTSTMAMPQDGCFVDGTGCRFAGSGWGDRWGSGDWDCTSYWTANHDLDGVAAPPGCGTSATNTATRFDVYEYENLNGIPDESGIDSENGNPTCTSTAPFVPADNQMGRREFLVGVVDCLDSGGSPIYRGNEDDVPVRDYVRVFMTEPVTEPPDQEIFVEWLGVATTDDASGVLHEFPVLYR